MTAVSNHQENSLNGLIEIEGTGCAYFLRNKSARPGGYSKRSAMTGLTRVAGIRQASVTTASRSAATAA